MAPMLALATSVVGRSPGWQVLIVGGLPGFPVACLLTTRCLQLRGQLGHDRLIAPYSLLGPWRKSRRAPTKALLCPLCRRRDSQALSRDDGLTL
jgi:hypothetical protein